MSLLVELSFGVSVETKHDEKTKDEETDNGNSVITNRYRLGG